MSFRFPFKTSFGHLQDVLARCLACIDKTSLRHLPDVFLPTGLYCSNDKQWFLPQSLPIPIDKGKVLVNHLLFNELLFSRPSKTEKFIDGLKPSNF